MKVLDNGYVILIDKMGNDKRIVDAARVSYNKDNVEKDFDNSKDIKLIEYLIKNNHSSPLEHVVFTFLVKTPIFVSKQWMRHRTFSYNEISRRYTSEDIDFYIPKNLRKQSEDNKQVSIDENISIIRTALDFPDTNINSEDYIKKISYDLLDYYNVLLDNGVSREQARMILPQNLYTKFYVTGNLWNWFRFLTLRNHKHAQWEIQQYAKSIEKIIEENLPETMKIWKKLQRIGDSRE